MTSVKKPRHPRSPQGARQHTRDPHLAALTRANHDLRSPLSVILGVFELLEDTSSLRDSERRYVQLGSDAAAELLNQADALRLYSAMARNLVTLEPVPVDLGALARERLQPPLEKRNVELHGTTDGARQVLGDPGYLRIALGSLAKHLAAHLQERGDGAVLPLRMELASQGADTMVLSIRRSQAPPAPTDPERPVPGEVDLAVVNAVRLIELMHGHVSMNAEHAYLRVELPAA